MNAATHRTAPRRRLAWLLWLALLLPLAQAAASWHALSHVQIDVSESGNPDGKQALHQAHCDLCLTVSAVTGGALPGHSTSAPLTAIRHATPLLAGVSASIAAEARAYRSRAPPFASH